MVGGRVRGIFLWEISEISAKMNFAKKNKGNRYKENVQKTKKILKKYGTFYRGKFSFIVYSLPLKASHLD